jgi:hypothetical protein
MQGIYQRVSKNVVVIPNGVPAAWYFDTLDLHRPAGQNGKPARPVILWRGSPGHGEALRQYGDAILRCAQQNPDWVWAFKGFDPHWIRTKLPRFNQAQFPWEPIPDTFLNQTSIGAAINLVCLNDDAFDRGRSPTAWLEGVAAGSITVAPDFGHCKVPGCLNYTAAIEESFESTLMRALRMPPAQRAKMAGEAADEIRTRYTWEALAPRYRALLQKLIREKVKLSLDAISFDIPPDQPQPR